LIRQLGIGVIGLGWMRRVHSSSYRHVLEAIMRSASSGAREASTGVAEAVR
jgi:hypothetical protein